MRNLTLVRLFAGIAALAAVSFASATPECRALIDSGDADYAKFRDTAAYSFYAKALEQCPGYEPLMKTTRALNDIGEDIGGKRGAPYFQKAMDSADSMQKKYPDSLQSYFLEAAAAGNLAPYKGMKMKVLLARAVVSNAKKAVAIDSTYAPAHVILGSYYRQVATAGGFQKSLAKAFYGGVPDGTLEESLRELRRAVELDTTNIFAHYELAQTYHALGNDGEAKAELRIVDALPDNDNEAARLQHDARALLKRW